MKHTQVDEALKDLAASYVLAMEDMDRAAYEVHLAGCDVCASEVRAQAGVAALLASSPALQPGEAARERAISRAARAGGQLHRVEPGVFLLRAAEQEWRSLGLPGIRFKQLHHDPARRHRTMLVRMDPGTVMPPHRHAAAEEILMLEGEMSIAGASIGAGDYCLSDTGSIHGLSRTEKGCTFLVVGSTEDEVLAVPHA